MRTVGVSVENQVDEVKVKSITWLFAVVALILPACAVPAPATIVTPAPTHPTPTSISKPVLDGQIVYSNENDIFVLNLADSQVTRVWSPDGTRIAFFSEREGKSGIWVMDTNGGNAIPVGTPPGVNDYPIWSPDSQRIAWNCTMDQRRPGGAGDFEICVANAARL